MSTVLSMTELKRMTADELRRELSRVRSDYAKLRLHVHAGSEKDHSKMRKMRSTIARMSMVCGQMPKQKGAEGTKGTEGTEVKKRKTSKKTSAPSATSVPSAPSKKKK